MQKACGKQITCDKVVRVNCMWLLAWVPEVIFFSYHTVSNVLLHLQHFQNGPLEAQRYP